MQAIMDRRDMPFRSLLFFFGMFLFVWRLLDPRLIFHSFGMIRGYPEFSWGGLFLKEALFCWGGPVEYLGALLSQYFYYSWVGALIVTGAAWSFYRLTGSLVALYGGRRSHILCYLPAVGVLMMYADYAHPLNACLAMLTSLLFVVMYAKRRFRGVVPNGILFVVFAVTVHFVAGSASLCFVILAGVFEIVPRRKVYFGLVISVLGAAAVWLVIFCFVDIPMQQAYCRLLPLDSEMSRDLGRLSLYIALSMYVFMFLFLLFIGFQSRIPARRVSGKHRPRGSRRASKTDTAKRRVLSGRVMWAVQSLLLVGMTVTAVLYSFDSHARQVFRISLLARHEKWHDVLMAAGEMPEATRNIYVNHDINRALFHVGRLGSELFNYYQHPSALLLMSGVQGQSIIRNVKACDIFLELGDLNFAEQLAYEVLELKGDNPHILDRLARINLVKGQVETARVFLEALSMDLIHADHAEQLIQRLNTDPDLTDDQAIERLRRCMLVEDDVSLDSDEESLLLKLLARHPGNRMAFEYLMAYYLLTGQPDKVVGKIQYFRDLGYEKIPRCFEEAIVLSMAMAEREPNLHGWTISRQTMERYEAFSRIGRNPKYRGLGKAQLKGALARKLSDTYFFYYLFGLSRAN